MSKLALMLGVMLTLLSACTRTVWVASVGNLRISQHDVEFRQEMFKLQSPHITKKEALDQLITYKVGTIILDEMGHKIRQQDIESELKQLKIEAIQNKSLGAVLRSYERNPSFSEIFLYPRMVENKIKSLYENDTAFNERELATASTLLGRAKQAPAKLETIAGEMGIPYFQGTFQEKGKSISWGAGRGMASASITLPVEAWFAQKLIREALSKIELGAIAPQIMPMWFGYLVVRRDLSEPNSFAFSVAVAPRKPKWMWVKQKSHLIPITKFDGAH